MSASPEIVVRQCVTVDDFRQCIELQRLVWRHDDIDIMPIRLYRILRACNSPTFGAFEPSGRLAGFAHTTIALLGRNVALHSHMVAVVEELRGRDIGYRMKLAQRDWARQAGIPLVFWTFDPLGSRNAHFNINKLGAIVRRYEDNYFGDNGSSVFDGNLPTDRLIAEWWIFSSHVESALSGRHPDIGDGPSVEIPENIEAITPAYPEQHKQWRFQVREKFKAALSDGIARGFTRGPRRGTSFYRFGADEEQFSFNCYDLRTIAAGNSFIKIERSNEPPEFTA
jgi:predicted GNAT superfamily acetyltransferase